MIDENRFAITKYFYILILKLSVMILVSIQVGLQTNITFHITRDFLRTYTKLGWIGIKEIAFASTEVSSSHASNVRVLASIQESKPLLSLYTFCN